VSIELITLLIILTFVILLMAGLPLAWTMGATAVIFTLILFNPLVMLMIVSRIYSLMLNYAFVAVPLFVFMAAILQSAGVAEQLFTAVHVWSGGMRGGMAVGTIISCVIMAAMVGIVGAEIVTFGLIALPAMLNRGYDKRIALGSICAGGGMATLIPPSVVFIVYAMTAGCSVGDLFIAGIIPGLVLAALFIGYIIVVTWVRPELAPAAPPEERDIPLKKKLEMLKGLIMPGLLAFGVLGSIYTGVATPSEAAGIGCLGALVCAVVNRKLTWENIKTATYDTLKITCMLVWLFYGAQTIIGVYTLAGGDHFVRNVVTAVPFGRWGTIVVMQLILIFLGMFLDWVGILFLTMPLFVPIILDLEFSNIWFGVVFCMNMHISYLSPPFGPSCFYMKSVVPDDITMGDIYRSILPFLWLTVVALVLTVVFPELSLWLPETMLK
jgi:tripartite ATP-independent transporter DctM subunit